MKALKTRRRRVAPAPIPPSLQTDLQGGWRRYTRLLPKVSTMLGVVTIAGEDHGALVRLSSSSALVKDTGGDVTMLIQSRVRMKLERLERQQHSPTLEMVEVED